MNETILTVDDNPMNLKLIQMLLSKEGYSVRTALGAEAALELLCSFTPDVVLMDIRMPDINGLQLIRLLKLNQRTKAIPIVAVSAQAMQENINEAYTAGCTGYITKPINTRTFPVVLKKCLTGARKKQKKHQYVDPEAAALVPARWDYSGAQRRRRIAPILRERPSKHEAGPSITSGRLERELLKLKELINRSK